MDFDTTSKGKREGPRSPASVNPQHARPLFDTTSTDRIRRASATEIPSDAYTIPAGAKKPALVHLALAAWQAGDFDPSRLGEVRGRKVDEAGLRRALYRAPPSAR